MGSQSTSTSINADIKLSLIIKNGRELSLSGEALLELFRDVVEKGVPFRFRARGSSMSPFIKDGDLITISRTPDASTRIGDVIAYINPRINKLIIHRVVGKKGKNFLLKGDNCSNGKEESIPKANIMGRVKKVERNGKKVFLGLGPERYLISVMSRKRLLFPMASLFRRVFRSFVGILAS